MPLDLMGNIIYERNWWSVIFPCFSTSWYCLWAKYYFTYKLAPIRRGNMRSVKKWVPLTIPFEFLGRPHNKILPFNLRSGQMSLKCNSQSSCSFSFPISNSFQVQEMVLSARELVHLHSSHEAEEHRKDYGCSMAGSQGISRSGLTLKTEVYIQPKHDTSHKC